MLILGKACIQSRKIDYERTWNAVRIQISKVVKAIDRQPSKRKRPCKQYKKTRIKRAS